jgi:hypothetical protein
VSQRRFSTSRLFTRFTDHLTYFLSYAPNKTGFTPDLFTHVPLVEIQRTIGGLLMSHETAFEKPASLGQLKEIVATLVHIVPTDLSSYDAQRIIENKGWLVGEVHDGVPTVLGQ